MAAKSIEDIQWTEIETPDRGLQQACSVGDADKYMGLSKSGLLLVLNEHQIRRYTPGHGRTRYVLRTDLDRVKRLRSEVRIEDESAVSQGQLLKEAAALLEQVQAGKWVDGEAVTRWLITWQKIKE